MPSQLRPIGQISNPAQVGSNVVKSTSLYDKLFVLIHGTVITTTSTTYSTAADVRMVTPSGFSSTSFKILAMLGNDGANNTYVAMSQRLNDVEVTAPADADAITRNGTGDAEVQSSSAVTIGATAREFLFAIRTTAGTARARATTLMWQ